MRPFFYPIALLVLAVASICNSTQLPKHAPQVGDAALDNYVRLVINNFFANLKTGVPELNIPPLDPFYIGDLPIPTLMVAGGSIDAKVSNIEIDQLSQLRLTSLHLDLNALKMDLRSILPYLKISGNYSLNGKIFKIFPLYGDGPFSVEAFDLVMMGGGSLGFDTARHVQLTSIVMDTNFTTMVVDFENLLGGGDLGDTLNEIVTDLGTLVFNEVKPYVIDILSSSIIKVVNAALAQLPPL